MWGFGLLRVCDFLPKNKKGVNFQCSHPFLYLELSKKIYVCVWSTKKMVAPGGIEPPTQGFSVLCSTN